MRFSLVVVHKSSKCLFLLFLWQTDYWSEPCIVFMVMGVTGPHGPDGSAPMQMIRLKLMFFIVFVVLTLELLLVCFCSFHDDICIVFMGRLLYWTTTKSTCICFHSMQKGLGLRLGWLSESIVFPFYGPYIYLSFSKLSSVLSAIADLSQ